MPALSILEEDCFSGEFSLNCPPFSTLELDRTTRRAPIWARTGPHRNRGTRPSCSLLVRTRRLQPGLPARESGTKTKCLNIRHFSRFPQVDSYPSKVASSQSALVQSSRYVSKRDSILAFQPSREFAARSPFGPLALRA